MKLILSILLLFISDVYASEVITCGDVLTGSDEAKMILHKNAQKRAQKEIEEFIGKKIIYPYPVTGFGGVDKNGTPENMATIITIFWCESLNKPLHSAYYDFYARNKGAFSSTNNNVPKMLLESKKGVCELN